MRGTLLENLFKKKYMSNFYGFFCLFYILNVDLIKISFKFNFKNII